MMVCNTLGNENYADLRLPANRRPDRWMVTGDPAKRTVVSKGAVTVETRVRLGWLDLRSEIVDLQRTRL